MKKITVSMWRICFLCGFAVVAVAACSPNQGKEDIQTLLAKTTLTLDEQKTVALALFQEMVDADEDNLELFERNYKAVLEKCPDTTQAHTAVWRLSNLYTLAYDEPQHEKLIAILEPFLERTTESSVVSMKKYPEEMLVFSPLAKLHLSYSELGQFDKIAAYYDKVTAEGRTLGVYDCFDYADALDNSDRGDEAVRWFKEFLKISENEEGMEFMREIAQDRIKEKASF
ncbi:MAG: hypothetical protein MUP70_05635 [Candidatus Aminicenantes bacterium]|nr:hypothetical protein [Candidatus Aminicenantes bacterium]